MEYPCSTNSMNYQQSTHPTGPNQYNQYSPNCVSNYGYYQGSNSTLYNSNSNFQTTCRYGNSSNSSAVPHQQEQGYYAQQYSSQQDVSNDVPSDALLNTSSNKSYCSNYINTTCTPSSGTSQTYQQSVSEM